MLPAFTKQASIRLKDNLLVKFSYTHVSSLDIFYLSLFLISCHVISFILHCLQDLAYVDRIPYQVVRSASYTLQKMVHIMFHFLQLFFNIFVTWLIRY